MFLYLLRQRWMELSPIRSSILKGARCSVKIVIDLEEVSWFVIEEAWLHEELIIRKAVTSNLLFCWYSLGGHQNGHSFCAHISHQM